MNNFQNTTKNAPFDIFVKWIYREATGVFRTVWAVLHVEPGPCFHSEKLQIIFANIRV
ncbi:hypothetical protein [Flavobacterium sp.]|uniref:hypothetical protein n=1 Tax=Flavobacterium sp. TaxID=239 RepID=UPI0025BF8906|nr:hypothetical protein [Flavobacterium sp.]